MTYGHLRMMLLEYFNESELRELCFDLGFSYETLSGRGMREKVIELIEFMERRGRLPELIALCQKERPQVDWPLLATESSQYEEASTPESVAIAANPFTYGNPISDPARFFGRKREIEQVFSRLRNPEHESSSLVGGRRIGKSSLLKHMAHPDVQGHYGLDVERYVFVYVDLQMLDTSTTPNRLWQRWLGQIANNCRDPELKYQLKEVTDSGDIDNFALADLFDAIDESGQHIVLLLDEFENVTGNPNFDTSFFYGLRSLAIQHNLSLITSSRIELIELTHSEAIRSSPFFNIFANINVGLFSESEAQELLESSLAGSTIKFSPSDIEILAQVAGRYPFFLQAAAHFLYQSYALGLEQEQRIKHLQANFSREAAPHLAHYWQDSDDHESIVLISLALMINHHGDQPRSFGLKEIQSLYRRAEQVLPHLEKRAVVLADSQRYTLFNTTFADWILSEVKDPVEEQQGYATWSQLNTKYIDRLPTELKDRLGDLLPLINDKYRNLVLIWLNNSTEPAAVVDLLAEALD